MSLRKRHRVGSSSRLAAAAAGDEHEPDGHVIFATPSSLTDRPDLILRLHPPPSKSIDLLVSIVAVSRSQYFAALLSDRWAAGDKPAEGEGLPVVHHTVSSDLAPGVRTGWSAVDVHVSVVRLLHTLDFDRAVCHPSDALDLLPVAMQLLFDDLVKFCTRYLESVPWSEDVEQRVLAIAPLLPHDVSSDLLVRVAPNGGGKSEAMLRGLLDSVSHGHPTAAATKGFLAKVFHDYPDRGVVSTVMDESFVKTLEVVKELMGKYASPDFRVAGDNEEREAIQRLNLHGAVSNTKHLHWLIERMLELRVAENAIVAWSEQGMLAADFQKTLKDDAWKNISPALPTLVTRCTLRLAHAVVSGYTLVPRQVRMNLVRVWLPVLITGRDIVSPMPCAHKSIYHELEEAFLHIISTLALSDAQELLQQCIGFSTRNVDDCPHLVAAFRTWFRRADRPAPQQ